MERASGEAGRTAANLSLLLITQIFCLIVEAIGPVLEVI